MAVNRVRMYHVAEAFNHVARVNHYMVGFVAMDITDEELAGAKQLLIEEQNRGPQKWKAYCRLERALDLVEHEERRRLGIPSATLIERVTFEPPLTLRDGDALTVDGDVATVRRVDGTVETARAVRARNANVTVTGS